MNFEQQIKEWTEENTPLGKDLGYPDCCIKEFCDQPPALLKANGTTKEDKLRYQAGCIKGKPTGFFPCIKHAKEILTGKNSLHALIQNRNPLFPPFPHYPQIIS